MKRCTLLIGVLTVLLVGMPTTPTLASTPPFDPNNFHHPLNITNPYSPLSAGTTLVYEGMEDGQPTRNMFVVTTETNVVDGVTTRVVRDTLYVNGVAAELTDDWFAQDDAGNVWYLGEATKEVGPPVSHKGSWEAGKGQAQPGIIMEAQPKVGDTYQQEAAPKVAQDQATVLSLKESICVPYGCFNHVLLTAESSPLEPGVVEHKYYAPGVGLIKVIMVQGGSEEEHLVSIQASQ